MPSRMAVLLDKVLETISNVNCVVSSDTLSSTSLRNDSDIPEKKSSIYLDLDLRQPKNPQFDQT